MAWPRRETLVRHWVAVVAIGLVAAIAAAAVWESLPGGAASRRLLTPIIEYHRSQYEINRLLWQRDLDNASKQMDRARSQFDHVRRSADDPAGPPDRPSQTGVDPWTRAGAAMKSLLEVIRPVGSKLRDAWLHEKMTLYHSHMKIYYEKLLEGRVAGLPPLPESLEVERRMIELDLQRRDSEGLLDNWEDPGLLRRYESEPPPDLARRAPAPMPKRPGGPADAPPTR